MRKAPTILGQVFGRLSLWHRFSYIVQKMDGDKYVKKFRTADVLKWFLLATIVGAESLRGLREYLRQNKRTLAASGIKDANLSSLSKAMSSRSANAIEEFFLYLVSKFPEAPRKLKKNIRLAAHIMDGTSIDVFGKGAEWAKGGKQRQEVRVVLLSQMGGVPVGAEVTGASVSEIRSAESMDFPSVRLLAMDRGYTKYGFWQRLTDDEIFFITRAKDNMRYEVISARRGRKPEGVLKDEKIQVYKSIPQEILHPMTLRRIEYMTPEGKLLVFVTNNHDVVADDIAELYRSRWEIEIFFKFLKQNFKASRLIVRNSNAVRAQIFAMLILILLIHMLKKEMRFDGNLFLLFRKIRCASLIRIPIAQCLSPPKTTRYDEKAKYTLTLF